MPDATPDADGFGRGDVPLPAFVATCLLLGGSSYGGVVANAVVQLAGVVALAWVGADGGRRRAVRRGGTIWLPILVLAGWAAASLVPLPTAWTGGVRAAIAGESLLLGAAPTARPSSLDPDRTLASLLSFIPFVAALALGLCASERARRAAAAVVVGIALPSVLLGALQVAGGPGAWYPYSPTNRGDAVGLFANADHLATLLVMALPLIPALAIGAAGRGVGRGRGAPFAAVGVLLLLGIVLDGSVAGLLLAPPAAIGSMLAYRRATGVRRLGPVVPGAAAVLLLASGLALSRMADGAAAGTHPATRAASMRLTARAARDFWPLGSGLGTFRRIYPRYEDARTVTIEFNVHAHNDYLELVLEAGLAGAVAIVAALAWLVARVILLWSARDVDGAPWSRRGPAGALALGGCVALAMLALHGLVDFPARTAAIAGLAGYAAALLAAPRALGRRER